MISIVGSCNIDYRSFTQNFEASAFIYEKETAIQLKELFMKDIQQCDEMTLEKWSNRSKFQKMEESFSRLFSPIL
jgi:cardiolipin synthase